MVNNKLKIIDNIAGSLVIAFLRLFSRGPKDMPAIDVSGLKEVLFIKIVGIGDLILLLPVIKLLKDKAPAVRITLLTNERTREVVEGQPFIDEVIYWTPRTPLHAIKSLLSVFTKIKGKFDLIIDAEHYYNFSSIMAFLSNAPYRIGFSMAKQSRKKLFTHRVGYQVHEHESRNFMALASPLLDVPENPVLVSPLTEPEDSKFADDILKNVSKDKPIIVIHPGTSDSAKSRRWAAGNFKNLVNRLTGKLGALVILTGTETEREMLETIAGESGKDSVVNLAGRTSIGTIAEIAKRSDLFISCDTGPMHVAASAGVPTIGLFGPNTPEKWGPYGKKGRAIYKPPTCSPCIKQYLGRIYECYDNKCMQAIEVDDVLAAINKTLNISGKF